MVNFYDYTDEYYAEEALDKMLEEVIEIDNNNDRYINMLNENAMSKRQWDDTIDECLSKFEKIIGF